MSKISELEAKINQARQDYYNGESKISDKVYDVWIDELSQLDPKNLAVIGIGAEPVSNWEKYTHLNKMGSLNKAQTEEDYLSWHNKYVGSNKCLLTLKLDGLSVSLIYENGVLSKASTRGSGSIGELITPNVAKMIGVPLRLSQKLDITIRGEIVLSKENHKKYFKDSPNPRNLASGISRRFNGQDCDKLTVLVYEANCDENLSTFEEQFQLLNKLGFQVPEYYILNSPQDVIVWKNKYHESLREKCLFELDGLVIHNNSMEDHANWGFLNQKPYSSIAYKFDSVSKEGTVSDIQVQVGSMGRLTPVAYFDPKIDLSGVLVEKSTLHNFTNVRDLGINIGAKVLVSRRNDVIPFLEEVIEYEGETFQTPDVCPVCNTPVIHVGEYVQCPNTNDCLAQVCGRIENYISELNILEWGSALITNLVKSGKVKAISDLYTLSIDDLASLDRMGKKSATKCYNLLWEFSEIPLDLFLGALSIPLIGVSSIKLIMASGCDSLDKFFAYRAVDFEKVSGIGPGRAKSLEEGLKNNKDLINQILQNGIKIKEKIVGKLSGKSVAFTGTMINKRAVLEKMATDHGGEVKNSVGKGLTLLVINDLSSSSSKTVKAKTLGTILISEDDFINLLK